MWIMVAGPYSFGANSEADRQENLDALNAAALALFEAGHVPIIGVNMALPVIRVAGAERYAEIMMPLSLALAERCDAVLRIGGESPGADGEVARFRERGLPLYFALADIPAAKAS